VPSVDGLLEAAAAVPFAIAVTVAAVGLLRAPAAGRAAPAELAAALALALEFLLAAGLLRLSGRDDYEALAVVASIVLLRKLISTGIRFALQALGAAGFKRIRA
jgi:uncharacterized membrane protein